MLALSAGNRKPAVLPSLSNAEAVCLPRREQRSNQLHTLGGNVQLSERGELGVAACLGLRMQGDHTLMEMPSCSTKHAVDTHHDV